MILRKCGVVIWWDGFTAHTPQIRLHRVRLEIQIVRCLVWGSQEVVLALSGRRIDQMKRVWKHQTHWHVSYTHISLSGVFFVLVFRISILDASYLFVLSLIFILSFYFISVSSATSSSHFLLHVGRNLSSLKAVQGVLECCWQLSTCCCTSDH